MLVEGLFSYDLLPLTEVWFQKEGFKTCILANKIEAQKKTGIFSSITVIVFFEDYPRKCIVKISGPFDICQKFERYLASIPPILTKGEKEVIIHERETVKMPCQYCGLLINIIESKCPNCGAITKK